MVIAFFSMYTYLILSCHQNMYAYYYDIPRTFVKFDMISSLTGIACTYFLVIPALISLVYACNSTLPNRSELVILIPTVIASFFFVFILFSLIQNPSEFCSYYAIFIYTLFCILTYWIYLQLFCGKLRLKQLVASIMHPKKTFGKHMFLLIPIFVFFLMFVETPLSVKDSASFAYVFCFATIISFCMHCLINEIKFKQGLAILTCSFHTHHVYRVMLALSTALLLFAIPCLWGIVQASLKRNFWVFENNDNKIVLSLHGDSLVSGYYDPNSNILSSTRIIQKIGDRELRLIKKSTGPLKVSKVNAHNQKNKND